MKILSIITLLITMAVAQTGLNGASHRQPEADTERTTAVPAKFSAVLIATAVAYCLLLLAVLYYAGWFQVS